MALEVLVTGGAGVLGGEIIRHLRLANYHVISCGRVAGQGVEAVWDIARQDRPSPDCKPQVVVHAAAQVGSHNQAFSETNDLLNVNIVGTLRVVGQPEVVGGVGRSAWAVGSAGLQSEIERLGTDAPIGVLQHHHARAERRRDDLRDRAADGYQKERQHRHRCGCRGGE